MDRKIFKIPFGIDNIPDWPCPTCGKGILALIEGTFEKHELKLSRDAHKEDDWDPEWIEYVYSCHLKCTNPRCREVVISGGTGGVDWEPSEINYNLEYFDYFRPSYFLPPLRAARIPEGCPRAVEKCIEESFKVLFTSPDAAVNHIRSAIEELLTDRGVKQWAAPKGKPRKRLNLHERISHLPPKYASLREVALAIKWLGNAGSHGRSKVSIDDALDCYEFTEHLLEQIYGQRASTLEKHARKINKHKGPVDLKSR